MTLEEYKQAVLEVLKKEKPDCDYSPLFVPEYDQHYQNGLKTKSPAEQMAVAIVMLYEFAGHKLKSTVEKKVYTLKEYKAEVFHCLKQLNTDGKDYSKYFGDDRDAYFEGCMKSESTPQKTAEAIVSMEKWAGLFG